MRDFKWAKVYMHINRQWPHNCIFLYKIITVLIYIRCFTVRQFSLLWSSFLVISWILLLIQLIGQPYFEESAKYLKPIDLRQNPKQCCSNCMSLENIRASAIDFKTLLGIYLLNLYTRPSDLEQFFRRDSQWGFQLRVSSTCAPMQ